MTAANPPLIRCTDTGFRYPNGQRALTDVTADIAAGEVLGVVGQNGSGKTTLVKHFNGLLKPTEGTVEVEGKDTRRDSVQRLSAKVGYVFQNPNHQLFAKSVDEELAFGPKNLRLPEDEIRDRVEDALGFFGLTDVRDQHPYRLSFPIRKVVGMASIYAMAPQAMVLDEPTTGQDNAGILLVRTLIDRLRNEGITVVVVSHDMPLIAETTERALVMYDTHLIADGTPQEVFADQGVLKRTNLQRPQVARLCRRLSDERIPGDLLSVDAVAQALRGVLREVGGPVESSERPPTP